MPEDRAGAIDPSGPSGLAAFACVRARLLPRAAVSLGSSTVENAEQVTLENLQSSRPSTHQENSNFLNGLIHLSKFKNS